MIQEFRHAAKGKTEGVADFVRRLIHPFQIAYDRDGMLQQTREALLYNQLQDRLSHSLMKSPAASGVADYLCASQQGMRSDSKLH